MGVLHQTFTPRKRLVPSGAITRNFPHRLGYHDTWQTSLLPLEQTEEDKNKMIEYLKTNWACLHLVDTISRHQGVQFPPPRLHPKLELSHYDRRKLQRRAPPLARLPSPNVERVEAIIVPPPCFHLPAAKVFVAGGKHGHRGESLGDARAHCCHICQQG